MFSKISEFIPGNGIKLTINRERCLEILCQSKCNYTFKKCQNA